MFIDTHAHLQWKDYHGDFDKVLENAAQANVNYILNIGTTLETSQESVRIAEQYPHIYAAVGLHPHDAKDLPANYITRLQTLATHKKVIAIGEIGLDFFYEHSPKEKQIETFEAQLILARMLDLPVSIHCRDAFEDCFTLIQKHAFKKGVFHCFTGTWTEAKKAIELGFFISISGIITFKKSVALQDIVKNIDLSYLMIETDAPYLAPEPYRGKRNEPAYVVQTAKKIAELKNVSLEKIGEITSYNARHLFGFKERNLSCP